MHSSIRNPFNILKKNLFSCLILWLKWVGVVARCILCSQQIFMPFRLIWAELLYNRSKAGYSVPSLTFSWNWWIHLANRAEGMYRGSLHIVIVLGGSPAKNPPPHPLVCKHNRRRNMGSTHTHGRNSSDVSTFFSRRFSQWHSFHW